MARGAAGLGENALRLDHAVHVVGVGLDSHEDHRFALLAPLLGGVCVEHGGAARGAGRGGHSSGDGLGLGRRRNPREQELLQLARLHARHRLLAADQALGDHVDRDVHRRLTGSLRGARLQHVELAALDCELEVLHVAVVLFEAPRVALELRVHLRQPAFQRPDRLGVAHAGDDVFTLRVREVVAVQLFAPGDGVARERDAGARRRTHVAENHHLHIHCSAEVVGDSLHSPVGNRALRVPGSEHCLDRLAELLDRIRRELVARRVLIYAEETAHQPAQFRRLELGVGHGACPLLRGAQGGLELLAVDVLHRPAEHLDETAPRVEREPLVVGQLGQAARGLVVEAEIEDGVHHPGHRELGAGANADQQRVAPVAEPLTRLRFHFLQRGRGLLPHAPWEVAFRRVIRAARLCRDGESGRNGHACPRHLGRAGALTAEQVAHLRRALSEQIDPLVPRSGHWHIVCHPAETL